VYIASEIWLSAISRTLFALLLGLVIVGPVIIVDRLHHIIARSVATCMGTTFFIALLAFITKAKTVEMFLAGAT
jgi:hypothetical protein